MKVNQNDLRTIRIQPDSGIPFHVPYRFFWNGQERQAASIVLTTSAKGGGTGEGHGPWEVRAFFLFGEIRDRITSDAAGITLHRTWSVKTSGAGHLSIDVEFDAPADTRCLFPGVHVQEGLPAVPASFLGEKTSYPAALFLSMGRNAALLFSKAAACEGSPAGIGISTTEIEDEPSRLRVEVRFPGQEEPASSTGPVPSHKEQTSERLIESSGSLERSHELFLAFSAREEILVKGAAAVYKRLAPAAQAPAAAGSADQEFLGHSLETALSTHLCEAPGVAGMREVPGSPWLSSGAGLGLAVAMRRLFPRDARLQELALQLADFALKGQIPSGFFYESYNLDTGRWCGVRGQASQTLLSVGQSSRIAELLFLLAEDLARDGLPHEKYFLAGLRFVEFFLDEKARLSMPGSLHTPGERTPVPVLPHYLGGLELFFPMARLFLKTGKDRYRKALALLVKRFSDMPWDASRPPCSREERGPDAAGALLATRLFVEMRALGYTPAEPPVTGAAAQRAHAAESVRLFSSLLLPWVRIHPHAGEDLSHAGCSGCLVDSFARQRIIFAGHETALLLLKLRALTTDSGLKSLLKSIARLCLQGARMAPLGTAWFQHTRWDLEGKPESARGKRGPVDSRRLAGEILAGLRVSSEFPRA
jgi:hypothetical protein